MLDYIKVGDDVVMESLRVVADSCVETLKHVPGRKCMHSLRDVNMASSNL
jgi:hypothetical protein